MLNASTRRAIRTGFDVAIGVLAVATIVVPSLNQFGMPTDQVAVLMAYTIAATVLVSKVRNKLEDLGWLPAPLKHDPETDYSHDDLID